MITVVVTHEPDPTVIEVLTAALAQTARVIVIDNGSRGADDLLDQCAALSPERLDLIRNTDNAGLAAAQNQGIARALAAGADWILLLDDDSVPDPGMVAAQLAAAGQIDGPIGLLTPQTYHQGQSRDGPFVITQGGGRYRLCDLNGASMTGVLFAIASGSLISAGAIRAVGAMNDRYFIDYIDVEFSLRLRRHGYHLIAVGAARLRHRLGQYEERRLLGRTVAVTHHSAWRRYHQYRNRIWTWRRYGLGEPAFLRWEAQAVVKDVIRVIAFEDRRLSKLWAMARGLAAGLVRSQGTPKQGMDSP